MKMNFKVVTIFSLCNRSLLVILSEILIIDALKLDGSLACLLSSMKKLAKTGANVGRSKVRQ